MRVLPLCFLVTLTSCGDACSTARCQECKPPQKRGKLKRKAIDEASGVAASRKHDGVFYLHNDSGDKPRIFAIDEQGADMGEIAIEGAEADDWEDIAVGPCDAQSCIFIGDIGDNDRERDAYAVYRLAEPEKLRGAARADELSFTYPDGAHNAETLLVHPKTGVIYVVTKTRSGPSGVYAFPQPPRSGAVLERVGEVQPPKGDLAITGGDIHPAGQGVILRSDTHAFFYAASSNDVGLAFASAPCSLPLSTDPDGEAIAWRPSGKGYLTVSEGKKSPVWTVACPGM